SVHDLSQAMGINPPSLYAAFGDKKHLFKLAIDAYLTGPGSFPAIALSADTDSRSAIERMLLEAAANYTDPNTPPGCMVVFAGTNCSRDSEDVRVDLAKIRNASAAAIRARISEAAADGDLPRTLDPVVFGNLVSAMLQGMSTRACDGASRNELEAVVHQVMTMWPAP
ncbi:MAG: TetR/AcrR family transcriptional regulator, partial [Rhizobiaceae bacterium]